MMKIDSGYPMSAPPGQPLWRRLLGWPSTSPGWWSIWLSIGFFLCLGLFFTLVASGQRGGDTFFSNPWLSLSMLAAACSAISAGVIAAAAIFLKRERSIFSFAALFLGLLVLFFALGEVVFPH
jgi:hypothetical protein